jgi:hypothetical protein
MRVPPRTAVTAPRLALWGLSRNGDGDVVLEMDLGHGGRATIILWEFRERQGSIPRSRPGL